MAVSEYGPSFVAPASKS